MGLSLCDLRGDGVIYSQATAFLGGIYKGVILNPFFYWYAFCKASLALTAFESGGRMKFGSAMTSKVLGTVLLTVAGTAYSAPAHAGFWDWLQEVFGQGGTWSGSGPAAVPEPATLALFATGVAAVSLLRRRRKKD